jgi:uncharacterized repeat protein (TIGR03837 family)
LDQPHRQSSDDAAARSLDLFCRVIDNYGDIGVCWRLARQLCAEYGWRVRLIVDDLLAFRFVAPEVDASLGSQHLCGIEIVLWTKEIALEPSDVLIEAFACDPPADYVNAMINMGIKPVWLNLEYLSAESWVDGVHGLPSPHPRMPLLKHFFVPGFTESSGGLIRERSVSKPVVETTTPNNALHVFVFCYPHAPLQALADALSSAAASNLQIDRACDITAPPTSAPTTRIAAVPQAEFDALLARYDLLIVRGEDSFVRAQYAAKPMLWHIYPTDDGAHIVKLNAWLDRYCEAMSQELAYAYRSASLAWNQGDNKAYVYQDFVSSLPELAKHAQHWRNELLQQDHLAARLVRFVDQVEKQKLG